MAATPRYRIFFTDYPCGEDRYLYATLGGENGGID
jgi:hypothetical protein